MKMFVFFTLFVIFIFIFLSFSYAFELKLHIIKLQAKIINFFNHKTLILNN